MHRHCICEKVAQSDYCGLCDLTWFEKDELEALRLLVEQQTGWSPTGVVRRPGDSRSAVP